MPFRYGNEYDRSRGAGAGGFDDGRGPSGGFQERRVERYDRRDSRPAETAPRGRGPPASSARYPERQETSRREAPASSRDDRRFDDRSRQERGFGGRCVNNVISRDCENSQLLAELLSSILPKFTWLKYLYFV